MQTFKLYITLIDKGKPSSMDKYMWTFSSASEG